MSKPRCSICCLPNIEQVNKAILAGSNLEEVCLIAGAKIARSTFFRHKEHLNVENSLTAPYSLASDSVSDDLPNITSPSLDASGARLIAVLKLAEAADRAGKIAQETNSIKALAVQGDLLAKFLTHSSNLDWTAQDNH